MRLCELGLITACLAGLSERTAGATPVFDEKAAAFLRSIDAEALSLLGVQSGGRIAALDTLARDQLEQLYGSSSIEGVPPAAAYLELYFLGGKYADMPLIYIREKNMRSALWRELPPDQAGRFAATWRLAPATLLDAEGWQVLLQAGRADRQDLQRASAAPSLREGLHRLSERKEYRVAIDRLSGRYSSFLAMEVLRVVPEGQGPWLGLEEVLSRAAQSRPAGGLAEAWVALRDAWRARDAAAANLAIGRIDKLMAEQVKGYPSPTARRLERVYNRTRQFTLVWIGFAASLVVLIVAAATGRRAARRVAMALFGLSTAILLAGFLIRWIISGRTWYLPPIMNQFEAVIGSALLGAVVAWVLELAWKRNYFAVAASLYAILALLSGLIFPEQMGAAVRAQHGILASPVMAAHVTVIIVGHALVGMTFFISYAYLAVTAGRGLRGWLRVLLLVGQLNAWCAILALLYVAVWFARAPDTEVLGGLLTSGRLALFAAVAGSIVFLCLIGGLGLIAALRTGKLPGPVSSGPDLRPWAWDDVSAAVDRCNLVVAQLACWTVVVGTILGAYWGDFAWGRWWGWDPKETWALITCLVYIALLHLRFALAVRWRGLVTALICILGCAVMLFNWVIVNYVLAGKHSYA